MSPDAQGMMADNTFVSEGLAPSITEGVPHSREGVLADTSVVEAGKLEQPRERHR